MNPKLLLQYFQELGAISVEAMSISQDGPYPNPTSYTWNSGAPINERKEIGNWGYNP